MAYLHINNLYKDPTILLFKRCYALEKLHGTSAHIRFQWNLAWKTSEQIEREKSGVQVHYFSGGTPHATFVGLFNEESLVKAFAAMALPEDKALTIYGESYGGKEQGMSHTYGKVPKFAAFDVKIGDIWLDVPNAEQVAKAFGLEFVHYVEVSTDLQELDAQRDMYSIQAIRNGVSTVGPNGCIKNPRPREGVVLRPLKEMTLSNGKRVIVKHKGEAFQVTATPRKVETDPTKLAQLSEAEAVANEWVTPMRLAHVLDKIPNHSMENMPDILRAMVEDVTREGAGEIDWAQNEKGIRKAITRRTSCLYQEYLRAKLRSITEGE